MFRFRSESRRRTTSKNCRSSAIVEQLEAKQLLSAVNDSPELSTQSIEVSLSVDRNERLEIEQVWVSDESIDVLLQTRPTGQLTHNYVSKTASVVVDALELPVRYYSVGELTPFENPYGFVEVESAAEFQNLASANDGQSIYQRLDPELANWREALRQQLVERADESYGELFGTDVPESKRWPTEYYGHEIFPRFLAVNTDANETNVQVEGVDEGDLVETDGENLFILSRSGLRVVSAIDNSNQEPELLASIDLPFEPRDMYLHDGRLTLIGTKVDYPQPVSNGWGFDSIWQVGTRRTQVTTIDVSDPSSPLLLQQTTVDGSYRDSRAIGEDVYVSIQNWQSTPSLPSLGLVSSIDDEGNHVRRYQTRDEFQETLNAVALDSITPPAIYTSDDLNPGRERRIGWVDPGVVDGDVRLAPTMSVLKFNNRQTEPGPVDSLTLNISGAKLYATTESLYLLSSKYDVDGASTEIRKISIGEDKMELVATGSVVGNVDDQYSVDEYDGYLRIATTSPRQFVRSDPGLPDELIESSNQLFVLQQTGDEFQTVGKIEGLAPTEQIYSMRYDGDRAWMVTFRRIDPVFSIDLSDPTAPEVTGELKIPGFSEYLQLIDDDHLLAIGRGAGESPGDGTTAQSPITPPRVDLSHLEVSLFRITDMENPELLHRFAFDEHSYSEAQYDPHAFNYLPEHQLLAFPLTLNRPGVSQLAMLRIDPVDGIESVASTTHESVVRRSVHLDDFLYSISDDDVSVVDLSQPETVLSTISLENDAPIYLPAGPVGIGDGLEFTRTQNTDSSVTLTVDLVDLLRESDEFQTELRVLSAETGEEIRRITIGETGTLEFAAGELPELIELQTRVLSDDQPGSWSESQTLSVTERPAGFTETVIEIGELIEWAPVVAPPGVPASPNAIAHYEIKTTDTSTDEEATFETDGSDPGYYSNKLGVGVHSTVYRAVFEDGSFGVWSEPEELRITPRKAFLVSGTGTTADPSPTLSFSNIRVHYSTFILDQVSPVSNLTTDFAYFERVSGDVEILSAETGEVVYSSAFEDGEHTVDSELEDGDYFVRARSVDGIASEWSEYQVLTIVTRPRVTTDGNTLSWTAGEAESHEVWISEKGTGRKVFHHAGMRLKSIDDIRGKLNSNSAISNGGYNVWVRSNMPDGTVTRWSRKTRLDVYGDAVQTNPVGSISTGQELTLSWQESPGFSNYEVYVRRRGEQGAVYRTKDLTDLQHSIDLSQEGEYQWWVRGHSLTGGKTKWGNAQTFTIENRPVVNLANDQLTWTQIGDASDGTRFEIWINRTDGTSRRSKVVHQIDLTSSEFNIGTLAEGGYRAWIRQIDGQDNSLWSRPVNFDVNHETQLGAAFTDVSGLSDLLNLS